MVWKIRVWWPCVLCLIFILRFTKWDRTATYLTLCAAGKNEKISHTPGRCVQIAWQQWLLRHLVYKWHQCDTCDHFVRKSVSFNFVREEGSWQVCRYRVDRYAADNFCLRNFCVLYSFLSLRELSPVVLTFYMFANRFLISSYFHGASYWKCILIMKANEMHYFSNLFDKVLYIFPTGPLSIIRSILTLYTRNRYLSC
jgi:hypothetical protein